MELKNGEDRRKVAQKPKAVSGRRTKKGVDGRISEINPKQEVKVDLNRRI